jgi:hypothetical protein
MQKNNNNHEFYIDGRRKSLSIDSTSHTIDSNSSSRSSSFEICIEINDNSNNNMLFINKNDNDFKIPINKPKRRSRDKEFQEIAASPNVEQFINKLYIFNNTHK